MSGLGMSLDEFIAWVACEWPCVNCGHALGDLDPRDLHCLNAYGTPEACQCVTYERSPE